MGWLSDTWETVKENASDICHGVLDAAGFIPVLGAVPDVINGCIYAAEGNALDAGMSFAAAIPGVGDVGAIVGKGGKYLFKAGKWLLGKGKKLLKGSGKLLKALKKSKFLGKLAGLGGKLLGKMKTGARSIWNKGKELFDKIASKFKGECKNGNGCFVKDTLVWTKEGLRKIQEVEKGEWIYSKEEHTEEVGLKRVKRVFESKVHTIYTIRFGEKEELQTTNYHPIYVKEKGWTCAIQLQVGDELCTIEGDTKEIISIEKERWEEGVFVYNFEVEDWESYFVLEMGVYAHNKRPCGKPKKNTKPKNRKQALNEAKDLAGVPRSQQPTRQWVVGDDVRRKGRDNYVYDTEPSHHGRFYEYDTPNGKRVVVDHTKDASQGLHTHAGMPKQNPKDMNYDFKKERYQKINRKDGDHHIRYK